MKRTGNLYGRIADYDNLRLAFYRAARGKRGKRDVLLYARCLDRNLRSLRKDLLNRSVEVGDYRYFVIHEPKERVICAAAFRERVLHHALMNVLEPELERFQIHDSYACRTGKGTDAALRRALYHTRRFRRFVKLDVRKYFDSISHPVLLDLLARRIKDREVLTLLQRIVDSYHTSDGRGLPIGNLTSQHLANFYLAHADHLAKDHLRLPGYIRYMDDMLFFADSGTELFATWRGLSNFVQIQLDLGLKPPVSGRCDSGIPFLGFVVKPKGVFLSRRKRRLARVRTETAFGMLESGVWTQDELVSHLQPVFSHLALARSTTFRQNLLKRRDHGHAE